MTTEKTPPDIIFYSCKICEFNSNKYSEYERHISTNKHNKLSIGYQTVCDYNCECGKQFAHRATLHNHIKRCTIKEKLMSNNTNINPNIIINTDTIISMLNELMLQNAEFKRTLISQNDEFKVMIQLIANNNEKFHKTVIEKIKYINKGKRNINKTFNINTFLADKCINAMNIAEFVSSIVLNLEDLERVGSVGFVEGISEILIKNLNKTDVYNRPFHCTNAATEIIFIKIDNSWIIDTNNNNMRMTIKRITKLNSDLIRKWGDINPLAKKSSHVLNDKYMAILFQAMGGKGDMHDNENKIIKRVIKHITITK